MLKEEEKQQYKQSVTDQIGQRMKARQKENVHYLLPYQWGVFRFDGNKFSSFTKGLKKPFDNIFVDASSKVLVDVMDKYNFSLGFSCSDQYTFVMKSVCTKKQYQDKQNKSQHPFGGKIFKLTTYIASYISVRFNYHIKNLILAKKQEYKEEFVEKVSDCELIFDGRILIFENEETHEIMNHMIWRSVYDCSRNTISSYARHVIKSKKDLQNKSCKEMKILMENLNFDFQARVPNYLKYGIYAKKLEYSLQAQNFKTKKIQISKRNKIQLRVLKAKCRNVVTKWLLEESKWNVMDEQIALLSKQEHETINEGISQVKREQECLANNDKNNQVQKNDTYKQERVEQILKFLNLQKFQLVNLN